jgi:putative hydrolase of the HAD superfamily
VGEALRYPVVFLDVGGTLIGPRGSFGEVYSEVFAEFGVRCDADRFNQAIYTTWDEMSRTIPSGVDRYAHFEGGESGYWRRFVQRAVELAVGEWIGDRLAMAGLKKLQERFGSTESWRVYEDVIPALEALRQRGARLVVVSNWDSRLPEVLKALSLDSWFEAVVVSHFEGVLDGAGATAAGVDWVWVDRLNAANEKAIPDLSRLPQIAENGL